MSKVRPEDLPDHVRETLARHTLRAMERFFSAPENIEKFEAWKARRAAEGEAEG